MVVLEGQSGGHRIGGAFELGEQCITTQFTHDAVISGYGVGEAAEGVLDAFVG